MAVSDVKITSSLGEAIGARITLQVGAIPTVSLALRPSGGGIKVEGGGSFPDIDSKRRQSTETVDISVRVRTGTGDVATRSFSFAGILDGYSVSNVVGNNSYEAILKHEAQSLLEMTTLMPGLMPSSTNVFKISAHSITTSSQGEENQSIQLWSNLIEGDILNQPPVKFYRALLVKILEKQKEGYDKYAGVDPMISGKPAFKDIFESRAYKRNLEKAIEILNAVNFDACSGVIDKLTSAGTPCTGLYNMFTGGPTIVLESFLNFLSSIGCSLIFGKSAHYVVPINSVIQQDARAPGKGELSRITNFAGPADYNSYSFHDVGYRDINSVILLSPDYVGGANLGNGNTDRAVISCFSAPEDEAKGSGVYVVRAHPWMSASSLAPAAADAKKAKSNQDGEKSPYSEKKTFQQASEEVGTAHKERAEEKEKTLIDDVGDVMNNYAETKYYQARFTDRQGSITLDFNPNWTPGVGGALYVRESEMFLHFYVNSVIHNVETGAPASGSALTVINFSCGRFGKEPKGATEDKFLGYTQEIEKKIREKYAQEYQE